jgi:hypothetical protein
VQDGRLRRRGAGAEPGHLSKADGETTQCDALQGEERGAVPRSLVEDEHSEGDGDEDVQNVE